MKYLFAILLLIGLVLTLSPQPEPSCSPPTFMPQRFPIALNQLQTFNLDDYFTGFNLQFTLEASGPNFAHLFNKTDVIKRFNRSQPGLLSYHLDTMGNQWGRTLITVSQENFTTKIRYGASNGNDTIPDLDTQVTVQSQKDIWCYDVVWLRDLHLAIVDCTAKSLFGLQNVFKYVNTTSRAVLPTSFKNDMYVSFTTITRRKMLLLREDGFNYLIRAYFGDSIDRWHQDNSYVQVMVFVDAFHPRTLKVIDRSFLHLTRLTITDVQLYMGNIYLLDFHSGVTVLDFTPSQHIIITGRYATNSGYLRLGVYSGNLDNHILFALANQHAIYEIDFTNQFYPQILTKYSIMSNATVISLWLNEQYVFAQISANVTSSSSSSNVWYNSTLIFSRGTRSYLNAYQIIQHNTQNVIIDLERSSSRVLVMEEQYIAELRIGKPMLYILPVDQSTLNRQYQLQINGFSVNTYNGKRVQCNFHMNFTVVDLTNMTMFQTGFVLPETYYATFPGELFIPLTRYVIGPNITWGVHENQHPNMSEFWILQQNHTKIHWQRPSMFTITFLRQQQFDDLDNTELFIYLQSVDNATYIVRCTTIPYTDPVNCIDENHGLVPDIKSKILNLTAHRWVQYGESFVHVVAIVLEDRANQVHLYSANTRRQFLLPIRFSPQPYEGRVTGVEFLSHFLAVLLRYTKQIVLFDIKNCIDYSDQSCRQIFRIDARMMERIGVDYFSPTDIYISDFHRNVLFITNLDRVVILSITRNGPRLLAQIPAPGERRPGIMKYKIAISRNHLLIVEPPNVIEEHSISDLYVNRTAPRHNNYPVYNYRIHDNFDLDFSDAGNLVYITATDTNMPDELSSVILVYRTGYPAISAFYDVFHVFGKYDEMLVDATGVFGDYVAVALRQTLQIFRQYEVPILVFSNSFFDFDFNVTYSNDPHEQAKQLSHSNVKIANFPPSITVTDPRLNQTGFLDSTVNYNNDQKLYVLNDSTWFKGGVVNYTLKDCAECGKKLNVINHVDQKRVFHSVVRMDDYVFTGFGGVIQQEQALITMRHNGSINQFVSMPSMFDNEHCKYVTFSFLYDFVVSACQYVDQVYLYITSLINEKPFVIGPYPSSAQRVSTIQTIGQLFIVVDVDEVPSYLSREGGILIYSINHNPNAIQLFDEIDFITSNDLIAAQGWKKQYGNSAFIGNAHLVYTNLTNVYRLAITELRFGVFFLDFRWVRGMTELQITKIQFFNMREELITLHLPMPNNAFFESVVVSNEFYDPIFKNWLVEIIVTTRNFHTFEVACHFDNSGTLNNPKITKAFYGYGFYQAANYIKTFDGYFALVYVLPVMYYPFDMLSRRVVAIYDTRQRWMAGTVGDGVPAYYMLGGMAYEEGRIAFDFNFTFVRNSTDPLRDIGLLILNNQSRFIHETAIHDWMGIITKSGISENQKAKLVAWNDFSKYSLPLNIIINGEGQALPPWAIALIVLGSIGIAIVGGFIAWKLYLKKKTQPVAEKESLLEKQADTQKDNQEEGQEQGEEDEEQEEQEGQEGQQQQTKQEIKQQPKQQKPKTDPAQTGSINRQTIQSNAQDKPKEAQPGAKPEEGGEKKEGNGKKEEGQ